MPGHPPPLHIMPTVLHFGNISPIQSVKRSVTDDEGNLVSEEVVSTPRPEIGHQLSYAIFPYGADQGEASELALSTSNDRTLNKIARSLPDEHKKYALALRDVEDFWWGLHSNDAPEWVDSGDKEFAAAVAAYFEREMPGHTVVVGKPDGWPEDMGYAPALDGSTASEPDVPKVGGGSMSWSQFEEFWPDDAAEWRAENLLTNGGRDNLHVQFAGTAAAPAQHNYMAFTANSTAPAAGNTTLTGEITTAGGGLLRGQATFAHTNGTNTSTLTRTVTANGSDSLPVTIAKIGVFNASSAGTMGLETLLNSTATLSASGDNLTVTETITAG